LQSGYELFQADSFIVICDSGGRVIVGDRIKRVGLAGRFIVGEAPDPGVAPPSGGWSFPFGYFIVDTNDKTVRVGLTRSDVIALLRDAKESMPHLRRSFWWFAGV